MQHHHRGAAGSPLSVSRHPHRPFRPLRPALLLALAAAGALPAQGTIAPTLLQAPGEGLAPARRGTAFAAVQQAEGAVVQVAVEVFGGRVPFDIERPSTGIVVDPSGLIVTWWSLVREADGADDKRILVHRAGQEERQVAKIVARDEASGLVLLRCASDAPLAAATLRDAAVPTRPGEPAVVLAFPDGKSHVAFAGVATPGQGTIEHLGRPIEPGAYFLTDARIDLRCDGAACLDAKGNLLGICSREHVRRDVAEPTLQDLLAPSFGFVLAAERIRAAFAQHLGPATGSAADTATAAAVAAAEASVVSVWSGAGPLPGAAPLDPFAAARRPGLGSGVVLSRSGLVATNLHLLRGGSTAVLTLADGRSFDAEKIAARPEFNLALLQVTLPDGATVPAITCADGGDPIPGETVLGIGNPHGSAPTVTAGVLSAVRGDMVLQADPDLGNRNGGGALVDLAGRLIAVVDGGAIDKVERAFAMQGPEAKVETNLSFCVRIGALRTMFAAEIAARAGADESIRSPGAETAATRELRTTEVARAVATAAPAMLNVYVSRVTTAVDESDNPFAAHRPVRTRGESLGSGVIVDAQGLAITNWHVVDEATEPDGSMRKDHVVSVRTFDGKDYDARVLSISREDDLALLQLQLAEGEATTPVELGDSSALRIGETVIAIGNPHGQANTVTAGIVTAKEQGIRVRGRWARLENLIETDAAINGGNSGGALIDLGGRLVGINSAGGRGGDARGYAIPVDHVRRQVLGLLLSAEKLRSPALGLRAEDRDGAVVVAAIEPDGPAARAGIAVGDRVLAIGSTAITWSPGFARTLLQQEAGAPLSLRLARGGSERTVERTVEVAPLSAHAWALQRMSGLELAEVARVDSPELVREAWTALHRAFTGDAGAVPGSIPDGVVRIARVVPRGGTAPDSSPAPGNTAPDSSPAPGVEPGDLLLAAELELPSTAGTRVELRRFASLADVWTLFQDRELSSYEGTTFRCFVLRGGEVRTVPIVARRLLW